MYDEEEIEEFLHPKKTDEKILIALEKIVLLMDKQNQILFDISTALRKRKQ